MEDVVGDSDLANVVKGCSVEDQADPAIIEFALEMSQLAQTPGNTPCVMLGSHDVVAGLVVPRQRQRVQTGQHLLAGVLLPRAGAIQAGLVGQADPHHQVKQVPQHAERERRQKDHRVDDRRISHEPEINQVGGRDSQDPRDGRANEQELHRNQLLRFQAGCSEPRREGCPQRGGSHCNQRREMLRLVQAEILHHAIHERKNAEGNFAEAIPRGIAVRKVAQAVAKEQVGASHQDDGASVAQPIGHDRACGNQKQSSGDRQAPEHPASGGAVILLAVSRCQHDRHEQGQRGDEDQQGFNIKHLGRNFSLSTRLPPFRTVS